MGQQQQIINGQSYAMYTPAWYDAQHAEAQRRAKAMGQAAGNTTKTANDTAGLPPLGAPLTSGVDSSYTAPPSVTPPSLTGLTAAAAGNSAIPGVSMPMGGANPPTSGGSSSTSSPTIGGSGTAASDSSAYAHLAPVDTTAAETASFNKAKDTVGQTTAGSLTGLRSALASRGMLGSGLEERGTTAAITAGAGQLGDVSRQQAVTRADEAQKNAQANFEGDITQRGQDFSSADTRRGQDFQKEEAGNTLAGSLALGTYNGQIAQRGQDITAKSEQQRIAMEQAQLAAQQRSTSLAGLSAALGTTANPPPGLMY